jgi:D-alanyl-D-alanine carboxypeptidase (penicillin-binding protein 5/6)
VFRRALHFFAAFLALFVTFAGVAPAASAAPQSAPPKSFILVDADTGRVLASGNDHEPLPPASTAKLMTALTAVERLPPDALIDVSARAAAEPASRITMLPGQKWRFVDALASLMMVSANDAAWAIAETTSGNVDAFAKAEAATARRYGMRDSTFSDPSGLDDKQSFDGGPRMSAYDIAISARNALAVPQLAWFAALRTHSFVDPAGRTRTLQNHNKMLPGSTHGYDGTNGMKTGYTNQAGHTFVATATRGGRTLIAVVMNTYDTYGWAAQYFDLGFATPPNAKGTGERLPPVRVSPYAQRVADRAGFLALVNTDATASTVAAAPTTTTPAEAAAVAGTTAAPTTTVAAARDNRSAAGGGAAAAAQTSDKAAGASSNRKSGGGSGWLSTRTLVIAIAVLLVALFLLRRRAVRRRRERRMMQRRQVAAAMRRGSLPVVDGRYRSGMRVGPPVESHVRIHRIQRSG